MATDDLLPAIQSTALAPLLRPGAPLAPGGATIAQDPFAKRAGPDVTVQGSDGLVQVYSLFTVDAETHRVHVAIVDGSGRLIRMIPPESVGQLIDSMNAYRPR